MDKSALRQAIVAQLEAELALQTAAAHASHAEATDPDSRAEGKFDMRGQSAAYLAEGQARLAAEISAAIAAYRNFVLPPAAAGGPITAGSIVALETLEHQRTMYFLGPTRGGLDVKSEGVSVLVITPGSPLGRQLIGRRTGDSITLPGRGGSVIHTVASVD